MENPKKQWMRIVVILLVLMAIVFLRDSAKYALFKRSTYLIKLDPARLQPIGTEKVASQKKGQEYETLYIYRDEWGGQFGVKDAPIQMEGAYETHSRLNPFSISARVPVYERVDWREYFMLRVVAYMVCVGFTFGVIAIFKKYRKWQPVNSGNKGAGLVG